MSKTSFHFVVLSSAAKKPQPVNRGSFIPQTETYQGAITNRTSGVKSHEDVLIKTKMFLHQLRSKLSLRAICGRNAEAELN